MEYIIIAFLVILVGLAFLIYKKLDLRQNNNDDIKSSLDLERERKKDLNEFKDTILEKINTQSTSLKEDFVTIKERVSTLQKVQEEMGKLATEVIEHVNITGVCCLGNAKQDAIEALSAWGARFRSYHSGYNREIVGPL